MRREGLKNCIDEVAKGAWGMAALPFQQDKLHSDKTK